MGSALPISRKPALQRSSCLWKEAAPTQWATLPNQGESGKEEIAKKRGKRSGLGVEFATLPGPQAATRLYSIKVTDRRSLQPFTFQPVTLGLGHTTWDRPVWEASFPETGAQRSSRWQALAHREQAILARDRMAHQSVFPGPDYQIGPNG
jgi:hypothetical protein